MVGLNKRGNSGLSDNILGLIKFKLGAEYCVGAEMSLVVADRVRSVPDVVWLEVGVI